MSSHNSDVVRTVEAAVTDTLTRVDPELFRVFVEEIVRWNPQLGLVSKRAPGPAIARLVRQSAALWDFVLADVAGPSTAPIGRVADIGSGAGFPGIIWKLLQPPLEIVLIERMSRRAFFLERVVQRLGVDRVTVVESDVKAVCPKRCEVGFDVVTMTAVAPPARLAGAIYSLLRTGGRLVTSRPADEGTAETLGELVLRRREPNEHGVFVIYERPA